MINKCCSSFFSIFSSFFPFFFFFFPFCVFFLFFFFLFFPLFNIFFSFSPFLAVKERRMRYQCCTDVSPAVFDQALAWHLQLVPGKLTVLMKKSSDKSTKWTSREIRWVCSSCQQPSIWNWLPPLPPPGGLTTSISLGPTTHSAPV